MARSESQGLQVAVILFTMLTVGLAVATYVYYSAADASYKKMEAAEQSRKKAEDDLRKQAYKVKVYEYIQGVTDATEAEIEQLKGLTGGDATAEKALTDFKKLATGYEEAFTGNTKGLPALPSYLTNTVVAKNKSITTLKDSEENLNKEKSAIEQREQARAKTAEEGMQKAADDLAKERESFNSERDAFKKKQDELVAQIAAKDKQLKETKDKADKDFGELTKAIAQLERDLDIMRQKYEGVRRDGPDYESPDGEVTWVNQRQRIAWINVGSADGLTRQTTFSVYDHDENGVASGAKRKARLEVIRVIEPHLSECRILEDEIKNPILAGDRIFTPAWSPGQHLHFALNGALDIDGDGRADNEEVRAIIAVNGGVVDAELQPNGTMKGGLTAQTRYIIRGKAPSERELGGDEGKKAFADYNGMLSAGEKQGAEVIDVSRFLGLMGWKAQERTVNLGSKRTGRREFRPRTPGDAGSAATETSEEAPATEEGEAMEEAPAAKTKAPAAPAAPADDDNPFD